MMVSEYVMVKCFGWSGSVHLLHYYKRQTLQEKSKYTLHILDITLKKGLWLYIVK